MGAVTRLALVTVGLVGTLGTITVSVALRVVAGLWHMELTVSTLGICLRVAVLLVSVGASRVWTPPIVAQRHNHHIPPESKATQTKGVQEVKRDIHPPLGGKNIIGAIIARHGDGDSYEVSAIAFEAKAEVGTIL